jgi:large subunit ribosomal protein L35
MNLLLRPVARRFADRRPSNFPNKTLASRDGDLCFRPLLMQKTKKSIAKRFKLTAKGKLVRRTPGFRHLLGAKSTKQKRRASRDKLVAEGHAKPLKRALPFGL